MPCQPQDTPAHLSSVFSDFPLRNLPMSDGLLWALPIKSDRPQSCRFCTATRTADLGKAAPKMARILIVEDEVLVAESVSQLLDHAGHEVVGIASDEASALKEAARGKPDLVLMDIRLAGGGDGVETARRIQAERRVPVVFMSAYYDPKTRARAATVQPAGFVVKPFSPEQLLRAVSAAH